MDEAIEALGMSNTQSVRKRLREFVEKERVNEERVNRQHIEQCFVRVFFGWLLSSEKVRVTLSETGLMPSMRPVDEKHYCDECDEDGSYEYTLEVGVHVSTILNVRVKIRVVSDRSEYGDEWCNFKVLSAQCSTDHQEFVSYVYYSLYRMLCALLEPRLIDGEFYERDDPDAMCGGESYFSLLEAVQAAYDKLNFLAHTNISTTPLPSPAVISSLLSSK
jgi:hypothetical protein